MLYEVITILSDLAHGNFKRLADDIDANLGILVVHLHLIQGRHGIDQGYPTARHDT